MFGVGRTGSTQTGVRYRSDGPTMAGAAAPGALIDDGVWGYRVAEDVAQGVLRSNAGTPAETVEERPPTERPVPQVAHPPKGQTPRSSGHRETTVPPAFRDFVRVIRRYKWSVLVAVVNVVGLAALLSLTSTPMYRADASILIRPLALDSSGAPTTVNLVTEAEVVQSNVIGERAVELLGLDMSGEDLASGLDADAVEDTEILAISYTADSRGKARERTEAFVTAYLAYRGELRDEAFEEARQDIEAELDALNASLADVQSQLSAASDAEQAQLEAQITQITGRIVDRQLELTTVRSRAPVGEVLRAASVQSDPVSPDPVQDSILGLVVGLLLGLSVAVVRDQLDDRVRSIDDMAAVLDSPASFAVPRHETPGKGGDVASMRSSMSEAALEAHRALAIEINSTMRLTGARSLLVTGARSGVGASTLTTHLAMTLARSGRRVVVVSADIRDPSVEKLLAVRAKPGLVDVLEGRIALRDAVVATTVQRLYVLPAGSDELRAPELLASEVMERIVPIIEEVADIILYDTPPVGERADALAAAGAVGRVLVVGTSDVTRPELKSTARQLRQVGAEVVAGVITKADAPWIARGR